MSNFLVAHEDTRVKDYAQKRNKLFNVKIKVNTCGNFVAGHFNWIKTEKLVVRI